MKSRILFIYLIFIIISCNKNNYKPNFLKDNKRIENILKEIPIGSDYSLLFNYIKKNNIPVDGDQYNINFKTKYKIENNFPPSLVDQKIIENVFYIAYIEAHKKFLRFPGYLHIYLFFYYDINNKLIGLSEEGYP